MALLITTTPSAIAHSRPQDKHKAEITSLRSGLADAQNARDQLLIAMQRVAASPPAEAQQLARGALEGATGGDADVIAAKNARIAELEAELAKLGRVAAAANSYRMRASSRQGELPPLRGAGKCL